MGIGQFCVVWYFFLFISLASLISLSLFFRHSCRIFVNRWVFCFKLQLVWKFLSVFLCRWVNWKRFTSATRTTLVTQRKRFVFVSFFVGETIIFNSVKYIQFAWLFRYVTTVIKKMSCWKYIIFICWKEVCRRVMLLSLKVQKKYGNSIRFQIKNPTKPEKWYEKEDENPTVATHSVC